MKTYYKLAMPSGYDFYTGKTINYRENIGKTVKVSSFSEKKEKYILCSQDVLHACSDPNNCFVGANIPCSVYVVSGEPVVGDGKKFGFKKLKIIKEVSQDTLDDLFGWSYFEAVTPLNPFHLKPVEVGIKQLNLLHSWDSVRDSVGASVWDSVGASVWAYIGSLFPNVKKWKYIQHVEGQYPFQSAVNLWKMGLVPSFNGKIWRLHGGTKAEILWSGNP